MALMLPGLTPPQGTPSPNISLSIGAQAGDALRQQQQVELLNRRKRLNQLSNLNLFGKFGNSSMNLPSWMWE